MKTYKLLEIQLGVVNSGYFIVRSTDVKIIEQLFAEVKKQVPSARMGEDKQRFMGYIIGNLSNRAYEISWLMIQWACEQGWEPFSGNGVYSFKQVIEQ